MASGNKKDSNDGCATVVGGVILGAVVLISAIPAPVWIAIGVIVAVAFVTWLTFRLIDVAGRRQAAAQRQAQAEEAARTAAARQQRQDRIRQRKAQLIAKVGQQNAALVEQCDPRPRPSPLPKQPARAGLATSTSNPIYAASSTG
ncbi:hypothetical protein [Mycolicibacter senuensis]|nr:hypothetical protein [Mycolicibacter senuensis]MDQ2627862.1 hypothetical protein [Actinomycetota bacterium]